MDIEKITPNIGAIVRGIDLCRPLDAVEVENIRSALTDNIALFFVDQNPIPADDFVAFGKSFGQIDTPLFATPESTRPDVMILDQIAAAGNGADNWHTDNTYLAGPTMATILQAQILPDVGGDTCFASMYAAYDALSPDMQAFLERLTATHSLRHFLEKTGRAGKYTLNSAIDAWPDQSHPVIAVHPVTKRRLIYVNSNWTRSIDGLSRAESDRWLNFLFEHVTQPEFQMRYRWHLNDVAFWDDRCSQHYAVADYGQRRKMQRIMLVGEGLQGP